MLLVMPRPLSFVTYGRENVLLPDEAFRYCFLGWHMGGC